MSIDSISTNTRSSQPAASDETVKHVPNLNAIAIALQTGDIAAAQTASSAVQGNPASRDSLVAGDLMALETALKSEDLGAAQQAFAALKHHVATGAEAAVSWDHLDTKA